MAIVTRIYGLLDPRNASIFYIGHTRTLLWIRCGQHIKEARHSRKSSPKHIRIREILAIGLKPEIQEIARLHDAERREIQDAEQSWINFFGITCKLTNSQPATAPRIGLGIPEGIEHLLGQLRDVDLARLLSVSSGTVTIWRNRLGIPPYDSIHGRYHKIVPPDWAVAFFGRVTDSEIASLLKVDVSTVQKWRKQRSIPSFESQHGRAIKLLCPDEVIPMLGKCSDSVISSQLGVCLSTVARWRKERGISTYSISLNCPEWVKPYLGNISDRKLSEKAGVSTRVIQKWRQLLSIDSFENRHGKHNRIEIPDWAIPMLGTMFDRELEAMAKVDRKVVARWRKERGIPNFESVYGRPNGCKKKVSSLLLSKIAKQKLVAIKGDPALTCYAEDPVGFIRNVLGVEYLSPDQEKLAISVRDVKETYCQSAHGQGKTAIAAWLLLYWVFAKNGMAISTAPTARQARELLFGEVRKAYDRNQKKLGGERGQMFVRLTETARAYCFKSSDYNSQAFQGIHHERLLIILDESGSLVQEIWDGALACITSGSNRLLAIGNPILSGTQFHKACVRSSIKIPAWNHPNVQEFYENQGGIFRLKPKYASVVLNSDGTVKEQHEWPDWCPRDKILGAISVSWIERTRQQYGEDSQYFATRVNAEFPTNSESSVIPRSWLQSARARYDADPAHWDAIAIRFQPRYGLDVGDGEDAHGLAKWKGPVLYMCEAHATRGDRQDVSRAVSLAAHAAINEEGVVVVDQIGVGAGALSMLLDYGHSAVAAYWGNAADDDVAFANRKAEQFWRLREALRQEEVAIAPLGKYEDELIEDLAGTYYEITTGGKIKIEDKEAVRKRLHRSTNCADAVVIGFSASMPAYDVSHNVGW